MKFSEKRELVRLLHVYQQELLAKNEENVKMKKSARQWECDYHTGVKAQYEHARAIATKLDVEIGREIQTH